jgi:transposase
MFWSCFSWDLKGPCHIWKPETKKDRVLNDKILTTLNKELEPIMKAEWELNTPMRRLGLRNKPGVKPKWKWDKKHGLLVRDSTGGIDWFRYCQEIVIPKIIPFTKKLEAYQPKPRILVQEDGASCHKSIHKDRLYSLHGINALLWPGNSPDLNMIEPAWPHLKRVTTKKGAPKNRAEAEIAWTNAWAELEQWRIQAWIEQIPRHIKEIIRLKGGNGYKEGKMEKTRRFQSLPSEWEDIE